MVKEQSKAPLIRPSFTKEALKMKQNKRPALPGLEKLPTVTGKVTVQMMEEFKCFRGTQNTILIAGQLDIALIKYLE